jgi:hypothetical protein
MSELNIPHAPYAIFKKPFRKTKIAQLTTNYTLNGNSLGDIPNDLLYLFETIEKSKYILDLQDDWDDEGSEGYEELSWAASIKFILNYAKTLYDDFNVKIDIPKIYEGPKGSIDIIWETAKYRLVVNIDKNGEDAMFYADNYNNQTTEGVFKLNSFNRSLLPIALQF